MTVDFAKISTQYQLKRTVQVFENGNRGIKDCYSSNRPFQTASAHSLIKICPSLIADLNDVFFAQMSMSVRPTPARMVARAQKLSTATRVNAQVDSLEIRVRSVRRHM